MATYRLKRKVFGMLSPFAKTRHWMDVSKRAAQMGKTGAASQAKWNAVKTGAIGAAKIGGAAAVAGGLGFGKLAYDKVTGQDVNNSSY